MGVFDDDFDPLAPAPPPGGDDDASLEEDDLLAPPAYGGAEPAVEEEFDEDDGGISDHEKIVRIWVEDGRLTKVRLSPVWFHKLPDGKALEARFRQALLLSTMRIAQADETDAEEADAAGEGFPPEVAARFRDLPELSRRSLALFDALGREMDERHAAVLDAYEPPPPPPAVSGRSKGVTVFLNPAGMAVRVAFEPKWLDDAQVGSICTHLMIAAERAYAQHRPHVAEESVLDEIAVESALYREALRTMLTPRDRRI